MGKNSREGEEGTVHIFDGEVTADLVKMSFSQEGLRENRSGSNTMNRDQFFKDFYSKGKQKNGIWYIGKWEN